MTTKLTRPVRRKTAQTVRDTGKQRRIVVTLYPGGTIGLRLERTRREEVITVEAVYWNALTARMASEHKQRRNKKSTT